MNADKIIENLNNKRRKIAFSNSFANKRHTASYSIEGSKHELDNSCFQKKNHSYIENQLQISKKKKTATGRTFIKELTEKNPFLGSFIYAFIHLTNISSA